jgi:hypothetical protein
MKVRVTYVVHVSDELRSAIAESYGLTGMANRDIVVDWYKTYGVNHAITKLVLAEHEAARQTNTEPPPIGGARRRP